MAGKKKKKVVVAVSGPFDPLHIGHVRLFKAAKKLGDKLVVILNNDNWLKLKRGRGFMPEKQRKEIIESLSNVDEVIISRHQKNTKDISVCRELEELKPDIFANGGDRVRKNVPEVAVCQKIGCRVVFNVGWGGKIQSSSQLIERYQGKEIKRSKLNVLIYQNYLAMIQASQGSQMFRHIYIKENSKEKDILKNGEYSCAYYVSSILKIFNLISPYISPHATVDGTLRNMIGNGWRTTKKLKPGNVLVWEEKENHLHLGFYLGGDRAISHRSEKKRPVIHHYTYGNKRKIIQIWAHKVIKAVP
jgi:cytidyltransferase-like protein